MAQNLSLKEAERRAFRAARDDGLWDVLLGCFFLMFAVAPLLSSRLGDFWSSFLFLPFWAAVYLAIWLIRKHAVSPRIGIVQFGPVRRAKLARFSLVMVLFNVVALVLGVIAAWSFGRVSGQMISILFGLILLVGFSIAAYLLDFTRLFVYGLLAGLSPLVGEWLWTRGHATHHGFPITFGASAGIMILVGLAVFVRLLRNNLLPVEEIPPEEA